MFLHRAAYCLRTHDPTKGLRVRREKVSAGRCAHSGHQGVNSVAIVIRQTLIQLLGKAIASDLWLLALERHRPFWTRAPAFGEEVHVRFCTGVCCR
jgi:hypothetical protein